ncbi:CHAT domain-containing protein [Thermodesulfobacteriota bacterium]
MKMAPGRINSHRPAHTKRDSGSRTGLPEKDSVQHNRRTLLLILLALLVLSSMACSKKINLKTIFIQEPVRKVARIESFFAHESKRFSPKLLPVIRPVQITFEADPVLYATVSPDAQWLVYTSGRRELSGLWLRSADPARVVLPKRLTSEAGTQSAPSFSPDGRWIAFTGTGYDAKGDIYLIEVEGNDTRPQRLTGRDTEDGAPCFSPDGRRLYFHRTVTGEALRQLAIIDLKARDTSPVKLDTGGDGSFPSVSPDGKKIAFVSYRYDPKGDLLLLSLETGGIIPLTQGPDRDLFPTWSTDGQYIYFCRFSLDTDRDGAVSPNDNAVICRVKVNDEEPSAYPVTSASYSAYQPMISGSSLYFLSTRNGVNNLWVLPVKGEITHQDSAKAQAELAFELKTMLPPDHHLAVLGYYKILERFHERGAVGASAAYSIGELYRLLEMPDQTERLFHIIGESYKEFLPEGALAKIQLIVIRARRQWNKAYSDKQRQAVLKAALFDLEKVMAGHPDRPRILGRSRIEKARLLAELGGDSESLLEATLLLDQVLEKGWAVGPQKAEAMLLRADLLSRIGRTETLLPAYSKIIKESPDQDEWADRAVSRVLEMSVAGTEPESSNDRIRLLMKVAERYRDEIPRLAMGAWNRIGDSYFANDEWAQAKEAYGQVLENFPVITTQTTAARLALAEILYREERFRQALDLYEKEMALRPYEDYLYRLARDAYIRKSVSAGEFLFRIGEVSGAGNIFATLIREDYSIVEAHRGYIKCAAARKKIPELLGHYRSQLEKKPDDPITLYATGLCLTYIEKKDALTEAKSLILKAIQRHGQVEYFHQTLGYIFEVLETVYKEKGRIEESLESYQKALFLNDPLKNSENNANLLLNLGNVHFLLGQYGKAFENYLKRFESKVTFDQEETEILFYQRFGASAFQIRELEQPVRAFSKALDLIDKRIDPKRASELFGRVNRYVVDRIITPALKRPESSERAEKLAELQGDLNRRLYETSRKPVGPPPDTAWEEYRSGLESLISEQEKLIGDLLPLVRQDSDETLQSLKYMITRTRDALRFPLSLIHQKAEMLDRLGLAFQEAGKWQRARQTFERAYILNERLGLLKNLGVNQRSMAFNTYMEAGTSSGEERKRLLNSASDEFSKVIDLVRKHGVAEKKPDPRKKAVISLALDIELDKTGSTQAMYGFSALQEERLAEAFISRIQVELGNLRGAREAIKQQLYQYPPGKPVSNKDLYGVSLLYHRAGHLDYALKDPLEAFDHFRLSAQLSHQLENPVSASINVRNMALALAGIPDENPEKERCRRQVSSIDRETTQLLERFYTVLDRLVIPSYHNAMGIYYLGVSRDPHGGSIENAARKLRAMQEAGIHFLSGLKWLEKEKALYDRQLLSLLSALHLNMAELALFWGELSRARDHFEKGLDAARKGLLPEHEWRALAGLGRLKEALEVLDFVSILRAGCGPGEITEKFSPVVADLLSGGKVEEAFNMVERLSEVERVHRLAHLFNAELPRDKLSLFRRIYPRLLVIKRLREDIANAKKGESEFLLSRLKQEQEILAMEKGEKYHLPELFSGTEAVREQLMIVLGMAVHIEDLAEASVKKASSKDAASLIGQYRDLTARYNSGIKTLKATIRDQHVQGMVGIMVADPVEAIDVMENLPVGGTCIRLFQIKCPEDSWIAFIISPDGIRSKRFEPGSALDISRNGLKIFVYEELSRLPIWVNEPVALSATHFIRSIMNRKPFKKTVLALPHEYSIPEYFNVISLPVDSTDGETLKLLPEVHTLLLNGTIYISGSVPTRPGQSPVQFIGMDLERGRVFPLARLSGRLTNTSLAVLPGASMKEAYTLGHLLSLFGVPTLLLPKKPSNKSVFVGLFFREYDDLSVREAVGKAGKEIGFKEEWMQVGFWGMTPKESHVFATKNFSRYVRTGIEAFKKDQHVTALSHFENALIVASETESLQRYLPDIYKYASESAYMTDQLDRAIVHARALADILAKRQPDSEAHARALLKLGLVQARAELYGDSIPVLERAVGIMENLELGPEQVAALADLGVVLENATEFDRALVRFKSAASLSKSLNKKGLLARQHMSIGRIYDLRMNMYALARQSYGEAYSIYRDLGDKGGMARSLLDMGRCFRLLGNFNEADAHYKHALDLVESGDKGLRLKSKIRIEQANNAWYQARYQEAFNVQREVSMAAREHRWHLEQVIALNTSGLTWWTLGDHQRALRELEDALALAETLRIRKDEVATTLNNMGLVYREMQRYHEALDALDKALAIDRAINSRWAITYDLRNKALTYLRMDEPAKAVPLFMEALDIAKGIGNRINEAKILLGFGEALIALGRYGEARGSLGEALKLSRSMALRETEWRALFGLGRLHLKEDRKHEAKDFLTKATTVIEGMRAEIRIDQLKNGFIDNKMTVYETLISLLVDLGETAAAFNIAERSRARNLIDLLGNQRLDLRGAVDQEMYDRQRTLRTKIREQEALHAQVGKEGERAVYGKALKSLNDEYRDLMLEIQAKSPELASLISVNPLTLAESMALMEPGVALLTFYVLPDEILCWLVSNKSVELIRTPIGRTTLEQNVLTYRRMIQNLEPFESKSKELYSWILSRVMTRLDSGLYGPSGRREPVRTLGIVPHGTLHYLSFSTLYDGERYVADRFPLFYLPSASVLRYTLERRKEREKRRVLAIGNPDLEDPALNLPFAEHEVSAIGWNFPDITLLTGEKATESWLVTHIAEFGIIHLASHGEFDPINPLFSAVKLVRDTREDGNLEAAEVFGLSINADLVVLSACQSGLGKVTGGDDVIGMNRAFLYGGTHAVLSTLWRVSDISTAILVKQFYRRYVTENKSDSLRKAMLHVKNRYPHPGYWGSFVLVGDYY